MGKTKAANKFVALLPFKKEVDQAPKMKGIDFTDVTITKLVGTEVLFDSESFRAGDKVYFRSDILKLPYANQKLQLGDAVFILIPEDHVLLVEEHFESV